MILLNYYWIVLVFFFDMKLFCDEDFWILFNMKLFCEYIDIFYFNKEDVKLLICIIWGFYMENF